MRIFLLALLAAPPSASMSVSRTQHYRHDGWALTVHHDAFAQETRCALVSTNHHIAVQPGAIGFRLSERADVLHAIYRIDDGPPLHWQDRYATLIEAGVPIDGPRIDQSFGGMLWLPKADVANASTVAIRSGVTARVRRYPLRGLFSMLARARSLGCKDPGQGR